MPEMIRADAPKSDRELLLQVASDLEHIKEKIDGDGGICATLRMHTERLDALENWRWYILGGVTLATFWLVALGQYIDFVVNP